MSSPPNVFHKLKDPPSFGARLLKPVYHHKNGNYIFMVIDAEVSAVWKYNLDTQIVEQKYNLPVDDDHDHDLGFYCIDRQKEIVYILDGIGHEPGSFTFKSLNLNTGGILTKPDNNNGYTIDGTFASDGCYFLPSPINELHITANGHFRYNESENTLIKMDNDTSLFQQYIIEQPAKFIYYKSRQQLMMFQATCDHFLVYDINNNHWTQYPIKLPRNSCWFISFDVCIAWDKIIFWFDWLDRDSKDWKIWCLDLECDDKKWYCSHQK